MLQVDEVGGGDEEASLSSAATPVIGGGGGQKKTKKQSGKQDSDWDTKVRRIGPDGVTVLAAALLAPHACPLQKLWLVNCDAGSAGARAVAAALYCNDVVKDVNLSLNRDLTEEDAE